MLDLGYIGSNLAGAWSLMNGRRDGLERLDLSVDGFWRSFGVILLILPFIAVSIFGERSVLAFVESEPPPLTFWKTIWILVVILIDWVSFPIVMAVAARPLGLAQNYARFIIARNWATFITAGIAALIYLLHLVGLLPAPLTPFALLVVLGISVRFAYGVARIGLDAPVGVALPVVIFDFLLSLFIQLSIGTV